jgi:hypothetical protein
MKSRVKRVSVWVIFCFIAFSAVLYAEEADTWVAVTQGDQIAGSWEGTVALDIPADETEMTLAMAVDITVSLWYENGADEAEMGIKMDFNRVLTDWSRLTGLSEDLLWDALSSEFDETEGIEVGAYSVYYTDTSPVAELSSSDDVLINTSGTKLQFAILGQEIGGFSVSELILYRK